MCVEETISPSSSTISTTRVANAVCAAAASRRRCARWPKRKFSPTETHVAPSRSISSWSMNSCAVCAMRSPSNGITISSSTPSAAIRSAFCSSVVSSFGADCGRDHGARVRLEGEHAVGAGDHLAVADVHAVELAHREAALPGRRIREPDDVHQPRKPTTGLRVAPPRGSARAIRPSASRSRHDARWRGREPPRRARPWPRARRRARPPGRNDSASSSPIRRSSSASATSKSPIRVRRSSTQYASPQVHDQRAHVGAGGALDRRTPRARRRATAQSKRVTVTSRSGISTSSPARASA